MTVEGRLRWAIFTNSVVSTIDNPDAHLWRALGRLLRLNDQEATFFEPRANDAVRALLEREGSRALSDFRGQHPDIEYRTLEPRRGAELVEWMSRTLATADVALIQANASDDLIVWLGKLTRPHLQTFVVDTGWNRPGNHRDDQRESLVDFSAIAVGNDELIASYRASAPGVPVRPFGPIPQLTQDANAVADQEAVLRRACQRLLDLVVDIRVENSATGTAPISPNGHRST